MLLYLRELSVAMLNSVINISCLVGLVVTMTRSLVGAQELSPPASDFTRHTVFQPILLHGRTKREISTTRNTSGEHHLEVTIKVPIDEEEYLLDLRLNLDLLTENHVLSYQENGKTVVYKPKKEDMDLCHYSGSVRDKPGSWVAVSTCRGIQGIVFDGEKVKYIEPAHGGDINAEHYLYDHDDLTESHPQRYEYGLSNSSRYKQQKKLRSRYKRHASSDQIRGPYKANERSLYVELALVADRRHFETHNFDLRSVYSEMKLIANHMNAVFSPLNIYIALVAVEVWNNHDEIWLPEDSQKILDGFLKHRRTVMVKKNILNDFAFLLTHQKFEDSVIGKAYIQKICTHESSGGVANYHTRVTGLLAMTVAHELGHSFGMEHDENSNCECQKQKCVMSSTSTGVIPTAWSSCSLTSLAMTFSRGLDYCLRNKPKRLFDSPMRTCGNGFVEPGEQCDCGAPAEAGAYKPCYTCCNPRTCMLRANATCGTGMCCDLKTCRLKSVGTVCRSANRECDLPEFCTGHSEYCPDDVYKMDTTPCGSGDETAYCVNGGCRSHSDQCRVLWGSSGKSCPNQSYDNNMKPGYGDCGYDRLGRTYEQCAKRDVMCGRLFCSHLSKSFSDSGDPQIGPKNRVKIFQTSFPKRIITCHSTSIDLGLSVVDFGLVPNGAKCGDGMMCLKQKCVSVAVIRERIAHIESSVCPSSCSGHGICNSAGQCHCEPGFAPPLCAEPGVGGSYDSGPASDANILRKLMVALYVIFLGIVPAIAVILLIIYCCRNKGFEWKYKFKLSFKSKESKTLKNNIDEGDSPIYANTQVISSSYNRNANTTNFCSSSTIYANIEEISNQRIPGFVPSVNGSQKKIPPTAPLKAINENNYKVDSIGIVKTTPRPLVKPKPSLDNLPIQNRPTVVHVKGLNSTTNKVVGKIQHHSYNVGSSDLTKDVRKQHYEGRR